MIIDDRDESRVYDAMPSPYGKREEPVSFPDFRGEAGFLMEKGKCYSDVPEPLVRSGSRKSETVLSLMFEGDSPRYSAPRRS